MAVDSDFSHLRFFSKSEFKHPELMDAGFLLFLDKTREYYGKPIKLSSDARSESENAAAKGSASRSAHKLGTAVDIDMPYGLPDGDDYKLYTRLATAALKAAIFFGVQSKLGLELVHEAHDSHVHLDLGGTFPDGYVIPRPAIILARD